jgi:acyl-CoA reductase-like NAD-dependent aldehyde dehydrogenase
MADSISSLSPVDGSIVAKRTVATKKHVAATFADARAAQRDWAALSLKERAGFCSKAVDAMLAMKDEIIPELAWSMGRPCATVLANCGVSKSVPAT